MECICVCIAKTSLIYSTVFCLASAILVHPYTSAAVPPRISTYFPLISCTIRANVLWSVHTYIKRAQVLYIATLTTHPLAQQMLVGIYGALATVEQCYDVDEDYDDVACDAYTHDRETQTIYMYYTFPICMNTCAMCIILCRYSCMSTYIACGFMCSQKTVANIYNPFRRNVQLLG